jgi:hypothetical protein
MSVPESAVTDTVSIGCSEGAFAGETRLRLRLATLDWRCVFPRRETAQLETITGTRKHDSMRPVGPANGPVQSQSKAETTER